MDKVLTVEELVHIIQSKLNTFFVDVTPVLVRGKLGSEPHAFEQTYYTTLRGENKSINLEIPFSFVEKLEPLVQKEVIVRGIPNVRVDQDKVDFYIEVESFEEVETVSEEERQKKKLLWEFLENHVHNLDHREFPLRDHYTIAVITDTELASPVKNDLENQLKGFDNITIDFIETNLHSVQELKQSIEKAQGDIIVLIGDEGNGSRLDVFNNLEVAEAWVKKNAYRITGLGNLNNKTLLDIFSHFSADTPIHAVNKIVSEVNKVKAKQELEKENKELILIKVKLEKKIEGMEKEKEILIQELENYRQKLEELLRESEIKENLEWEKEKSELVETIEKLKEEIRKKDETILKLEKDLERKEKDRQKWEQEKKKSNEIRVRLEKKASALEKEKREAAKVLTIWKIIAFSAIGLLALVLLLMLLK